jgi:hypothetical protein
LYLQELGHKSPVSLPTERAVGLENEVINQSDGTGEGIIIVIPKVRLCTQIIPNFGVVNLLMFNQLITNAQEKLDNV